MNRIDTSKLMLSLSEFLKEPFLSEIYEVNVHTDHINILMNNSDYSKEELFSLIDKHFNFLTISFKQYNKITECVSSELEEMYLHHQLIFFFKN